MEEESAERPIPGDMNGAVRPAVLISPDLGETEAIQAASLNPPTALASLSA